MPAFGRLLCYGAPSTAFWRKRSDASVSTKALLTSAMLTTESWATEVRSCPWPQYVTVLQGNYACMHIMIGLERYACMYTNVSMQVSLTSLVYRTQAEHFRSRCEHLLSRTNYQQRCGARSTLFWRQRSVRSLGKSRKW